MFLKEKAAQSEGSHLGGLQGFELLRGLFPAALPLVSLGPPLAMGALQSSLGAVPFPSFLPSLGCLGTVILAVLARLLCTGCSSLGGVRLLAQMPLIAGFLLCLPLGRLSPLV